MLRQTVTVVLVRALIADTVLLLLVTDMALVLGFAATPPGPGTGIVAVTAAVLELIATPGWGSRFGAFASMTVLPCQPDGSRLG
jgi:hypothetical protein